MSPYKVIDKPGLVRLTEAVTQAVSETQSTIDLTNKSILDYKNLICQLDNMLNETSVNVMVPLGKVAYMQGTLINTKKVMVHLGAEWFVETPVSHAKEIIGRRLKTLHHHLNQLNGQRTMFERELQYTNHVKQEEECQEIVEHYTEEEYRFEQEKHKENVRESHANKQKDITDLDKFFSQYNDDDGPDDDDDDDEHGIHEGFKSCLTELNVNGLEFIKSSTGVDVNDNKQDTVATPCAGGSSEPVLTNENLSDDGDRLMIGQTSNVVSKTTKDEPTDKSDEANELVAIGNGSKDASAIESNSHRPGQPELDELVKPKKSVTWSDRQIEDYGESDEEEEDSDDEEEEVKPKTIEVNFKHSPVEPVICPQCSTEELNNDVAIRSPRDIYTQFLKPKSILKKSSEPSKKYTPIKKVETKRSDVSSGEVVERNHEQEVGTRKQQHNTQAMRVSQFMTRRLGR